MLKSLEMYGFKSFADRTRFDFASGITGVVGPNGSGKSNVVDALKWILGDQSAKSLRGKEMTDVIFNGSSSRKPCGYAEAFLTIDNSARILEIDATEVVIGRRIHRSGDAEYLINRAPARLKDVRDLLMGTGAGNAAYCIIEQGRVDQILQANPSARRLVFEEAAGISRFKSRRVEAQRKLERVAQNLQRLSDIVDEVEAQLNTTRGQAAKAVKYREISTELERWWLGLAADDYRHITAELEAIKGRLAESASRLEELADRQKVCDAAEAEFDRDLSRIEQHLRDADRKLATHREKLATQEANVRFQTVRLGELDGELTRLRQQQLLLQSREQDGRLDLDSARIKLAELERDNERLQSRLLHQDDQLQQAARHVAERQTALAECQGNRQALRERLASTEQTLAAVQAQLELVATAREKSAARWNELTQEHTATEGIRAERQLHYESRQREFAALNDRYRSHLSQHQQRVGVQETLRSSVAGLREGRSAALARKSLLEDLELRQEGLGIGVKELLHRAKHSRETPWNSILGSVADLLDVDLEHAGLIEVALGPRAQLVVLNEYQPLLDYLNRGSATLTGRVSFLAIPPRTPPSTRRPREDLVHLLPLQDPRDDLSGAPGVIARADRLITSEHGIAGLAAAVLADTWIVENLDAAVTLLTGIGQGLRYVTLQGELVEPQGALQLGTVRSETSLLSRKSELRRLKNDLIRLERELQTRETELSEVQLSTDHSDRILQELKEELDRRTQEVADAMASWREADQNADRLRRDLDSVSGQLAASDEETLRYRRQSEDVRARLNTLREESEAAEHELQLAESNLTEAQQSAQALEQRKRSEQLDLVKQAERIGTLRDGIVRLENDLGQRVLQREEAVRRVGACELKQQQLRLQILNARANLADDHGEADQAWNVVHHWQAEKELLRQRRTSTVEQELKIRQARRELQERRHTDEIRERELRQSLVTLRERIQEEYQRTLEEVATDGISAQTLFEQSGSLGDTDSAKDTRAVPAETALPPAVERPFLEIRPEIEAHVSRLRRKLKLLGNVNTDSLRDLEQLEQRFLTLSSHLQDLVEAKSTLEDIIRRINTESKRLFAETFKTIRANFQHLFRKVFGGGEGDIVLEDPEDILECGIEITARPPGKELRSLSLLSGGEKTMTAIAMIMAIFQAKPSPFCILDEVDAALDEANVDRFASVLREFQNTTQFIMITHHKRSMIVADALYGVTMEESGVSKRMSVRFEDISDQGNFRSAA